MKKQSSPEHLNLDSDDEQPWPENEMPHNFRFIMLEAHSLHFQLPLCEF